MAVNRFIITILSLLIAACSTTPQATPMSSKPSGVSKFDLARFDQVQLGITTADVVKLLGEPSSQYKKQIDPNASYWLYNGMTVKFDQNSNVTAKSIEPRDSRLTLASLQSRYNLKDLSLVKTVVGCRKQEEKLGSDVYYSRQLGAQIAVSFKGDIQRVVQNEELKQKPEAIRSHPVCQQ